MVSQKVTRDEQEQCFSETRKPENREERELEVDKSLAPQENHPLAAESFVYQICGFIQYTQYHPICC